MNKELAVEVSGLVKVYHDGDHPVPVPLRRHLQRGPRGRPSRSSARRAPGKSTLLHAVGGLDTIDSGEVRVAGTSLRGFPRRRSASFATARSASSTSFTTSCPSSRRSTTSRCRLDPQGGSGGLERGGPQDARGRGSQPPPAAPALAALRAASASASPLHAPSSRSPSAFSPTSRRATSTRRPPRASSTSSSSSRATRARPS